MDKIVDETELNEIMDNDIALIKECFNDFIIEYPQILSDIKKAIKSQDASRLGTSAHKLKGSLKYLAAKPAAEIASQLEYMGKKETLDKSQDIYINLETECQKLQVFMEAYGA